MRLDNTVVAQQANTPAHSYPCPAAVLVFYRTHTRRSNRWCPGEIPLRGGPPIRDFLHEGLDATALLDEIQPL